MVERAVSGGAGRERRDRVRDHVVAHGFVRIEELAEAFEVSAMTIHRDLDALQREGWLRKIRGGATAEPSAVFHGDVRHRMRAMSAEKEALAAAVLEMVRPGDAVALDDSTTGLCVARRLGERAPVTVVTNFLAGITALAGVPGVDLVGLGGAYYPGYDAFLGMRTLEAIQQIRADLLVMSTTAVTDGVCYHTSTETIQVKRALMSAAARRVLLVDHTKFSRRALNRLCALTDFDAVLVDSGLAETTRDALRDRDVPLRVIDTA
jgi:DeoR/GlpR family transcriptional regulator of sugar metabolism